MSGDKYSVTRQQNVSPDVLSLAKMVNIIKTIAPVEKVTRTSGCQPTIEFELLLNMSLMCHLVCR